MKLERALSKNIGVKVYDERKHKDSWSIKTKTRADAYFVAYQYRHKKQVQVIATDVSRSSWTVRIANEPIYNLDPDSPYYISKYPLVWNPNDFSWLPA